MMVYVKVSDGAAIDPQALYEVAEDAHGDVWALLWSDHQERFWWELVELTDRGRATVA